MELKAKLEYPYTFQEKYDFIILNNDKLGFEIRNVEREIVVESNEIATDSESPRNDVMSVIDLEAWGYTEEEKQEQERERIDNLTLTAADVERAIYKDKNMDFEDLINLVQERYSDVIDVKRLKIELKANSFFRKHEYINQLGELLGYTPFQLDYLFKNKEFSEDINE